MASRERFRLRYPPLGHGAFGVVYLADDLMLDLQVAIKIPHDEILEVALRREAALMMRIRHLNETHLVSMHDMHEINGQQVIVMEYAGDSLRSLLGRIVDQPNAPLDAARTLEIGIQVCKGLEALHGAFGEAGVFHRDLKPENILIRKSDGIAKIGDFGIARLMATSGHGSTTVGTPPYMAPELIDSDGVGQRSDYRADLYALGVTLFEMLMGRLPFSPFDEAKQEKTPSRYQKEIRAGLPAQPHALDGLDPILGDLVRRAMHPDPRKRFQSAIALRTALDEVRTNMSPEAAIAAAWAIQVPSAKQRSLADIVRRFPTDARSYRNLAWFFNSQVLFTRSIETLEVGRIKALPNGDLLLDLAIAYSQVGEISRALEMLEEAKAVGLPLEMRRRVAALSRSWRARQ